MQQQDVIITGSPQPSPPAKEDVYFRLKERNYALKKEVAALQYDLSCWQQSSPEVLQDDFAAAADATISRVERCDSLRRSLRERKLFLATLRARLNARRKQLLQEAEAKSLDRHLSIASSSSAAADAISTTTPTRRTLAEHASPPPSSRTTNDDGGDRAASRGYQPEHGASASASTPIGLLRRVTLDDEEDICRHLGLDTTTMSPQPTAPRTSACDVTAHGIATELRSPGTTTTTGTSSPAAAASSFQSLLVHPSLPSAVEQRLPMELLTREQNFSKGELSRVCTLADDLRHQYGALRKRVQHAAARRVEAVRRATDKCERETERLAAMTEQLRNLREMNRPLPPKPHIVRPS